MAYLYKNHIPTQSPKITVSRMRIFADQQQMIGTRVAGYMDSGLWSSGEDEWNGLGNSYDFKTTEGRIYWILDAYEKSYLNSGTNKYRPKHGIENELEMIYLLNEE